MKNHSPEQQCNVTMPFRNNTHPHYIKRFKLNN